MQSLLLDRKVNRITGLQFSTAITESFYTNFKQQTGRNVFPNNPHSNAAVNSLSLESENRFLLSGCADSSIKLWDMKQTQNVELIGDEMIRNSNSNSEEFIEDEDDEVQEDEGDNYIYDHPKSTIVNIATIPRRAAHDYGVSCIQWWPYDSGMFVSSSFDHTVKVWDTNELEVVHSFDMENRVYSIDICGNTVNTRTSTALVAVASDQPFIRILDLRTTAAAHSLSGHKGKTLSVKWHTQNPNILASGGYDGEVKIWDIRRSQSCLCRLDMLRTNSSSNGDVDDILKKASVKAHSGPVNGLAWDPMGHTLYTTGNDDKIRVWDMVSSYAPPINKLVNFGPLTRNKYPQTIPLLLSPSKETELQYLMFPSDNGDIFIFRTIDGKLVSRLLRKGTKNSGRTSSMVYMGNSSGTYLCGTMDGEIIKWSHSLDI
ncbi:hypothetical protein CAAN1_13S01442 [[Candida] anglica]|uniref:Anaphase-promoting complex subunit 4 WD40 domain-containing protein n=1 Tax=[Candida] anglica TaxID=148631 RepID=A0ABP0EIV6_9ASCO